MPIFPTFKKIGARIYLLDKIYQTKFDVESRMKKIKSFGYNVKIIRIVYDGKQHFGIYSAPKRRK